MEEFIKENPNWFAKNHSKIGIENVIKEEKIKIKGEEKDKVEIEEKKVGSEIDKNSEENNSNVTTAAKLDSGIFESNGNYEEIENCDSCNNTKMLTELQNESNKW